MKSNTRGGLCLKALLLLTVAIILTLLFLPKVAVSGKGKAETLVSATSTTIEAVKEIEEPTKSPSVSSLEQMPQVLLDISWCESRDRQERVGYNKRADGTVWSRDIGRWQINDYYHAETARRMGFDIYTEEGNALYALVLYNTNGTRDWNASKPCWSNIEAWKAKEQSYYQ